MTFRQRIIIAFTIVLVLPVLLFMLSFIVIGNVLARGEDEDSAAQYFGYESLTEDYQQYSVLLDSTFEDIKKDLDEDPAIIEDPGYLQSLSERVSAANSYILVRKGKDLYYTGNEAAAEKDLPVLPGYRGDRQNEGTSYYIDSMAKMVKQLDFLFEDDSGRQHIHYHESGNPGLAQISGGDVYGHGGHPALYGDPSDQMARGQFL